MREITPRRRKTYAQEWIDNTPELKRTEWTNELNGQHEQGLASRLYQACLHTFREIGRDTAQDASIHKPQSFPSTDKKSAGPPSLIDHKEKSGVQSSERSVVVKDDQIKGITKDQMARLLLWGEGFGDGRLDKGLDQSDELKIIILDLLCDVAVELQKKLWLQQSSPHPTYPTEAVKEMNVLVEQARMVIARDTHESVRAHGNDGSTISSMSSHTRSSESEALEVSHNLNSTIQNLMNLAPAIENNLSHAERKDTVYEHTNDSTFSVSQPAQTYVSHVRDKFREAPARLVERLGEANWQRHVVIRAILNREGGVPEDKETILAAFQPKSMFHDSGLGTTTAASSHPAASLASHTSFLSSVAERQRESVRTPPTPIEISAGKPFTCFICGRIQRKLKNRVDWKMHIFTDLQPYICTSSTCDQELVQFSTRQAWVEHEFSEHHQLRIWKCSKCVVEYADPEQMRKHAQIGHADIALQPHLTFAMGLALDYYREIPITEKSCPLCQESLGDSRRAYSKHVGRHMEEVALMVLPKQDPDSDQSSNDESDRENKTAFTGMQVVHEESTHENAADVSAEVEKDDSNEKAASLNENPQSAGISNRTYNLRSSASLKPSHNNNTSNTTATDGQKAKHSKRAPRGRSFAFEKKQQRLLEEAQDLEKTKTKAQASCQTKSTAMSESATNPIDFDSRMLPSGDIEVYTVKCICGYQRDDGSTVFCERCKTWQHTACYYSDEYGVVPTNADLAEMDHLCIDCHPKALEPWRQRQASARVKNRREDSPIMINPIPEMDISIKVPQYGPELNLEPIGHKCPHCDFETFRRGKMRWHIHSHKKNSTKNSRDTTTTVQRKQSNHPADSVNKDAKISSRASTSPGWDPEEISQDNAQARRRKRRGSLSIETTKVLEQWFKDHLEQPYPTKKELRTLCRQTGLQGNQISPWFEKARSREDEMDARLREAFAVSKADERQPASLELLADSA